MAKRLPFRTAIAGLTALAITSPIVAPVNTSLLAAAVAQVREDLSDANKLVFTARPNTASDNPAEVAYNTEGTFTVQVPNAEPNSTVQFFLDGVPQGDPVAVSNGYASITVKPTSFTNDAFKHVVTARYVDPNGFNVRADVTKEFSTKLTDTAVPKEARSQNVTDEEIRDGRYSFTINGASKTDSNPQELKPGQEFTLNGKNRFTSTWGSFTNVYEIGLNPPAGAEFVSGERRDRASTIAYQGANADGTGVRKNADADGNWGIGSNPKVNPGFISYRPEDFKMFSQTAEVEGKFKAPQTPGIYYPQFAIFKYTGFTGGNKTRYMHRMDTAVFRVTPLELPTRNLRTDVTVALAPDQKLQAAVDGTLTATVSPKASGTVTFIHPGSNGQPDKVLGTAGIVEGEAKLHPVKFETMGEQDIKLKFTPAPGTNWAESEGTGQVNVEHAPAKETSITLTLPGETVQGVQFDATATVEQKVDGTIQFYSVVTDEWGNKTDVKYAEPIPVNEGNNWTAKVQPKLFQLGLQTAKAVFTPRDTKAYKGSEKTQDIYIKQPTTSLSLKAEADKNIGEEVKITATISPAVGGNVLFFDGDTLLEKKAVEAGTSEVTITNVFDKGGSHALRAEFIPTDNVTYPVAQNSTSLVINDKNKINTELKLTADKPQLTVGESTTVTATVPQGIEGRVMFDDGTGVQAWAKVDKDTGKATFSYVPRTDGKKTVQAEFIPINESAASYNGATSTVDVNVNPRSTEAQDTDLHLTGPATSTAGDTFKLIAYVYPRGAEGTVQFSNGTEPLGGPVKVINGMAAKDVTINEASLNDFKAVFTPKQGSVYIAAEDTHSVKVNAKPEPTTVTATATTTQPTTVEKPTTVTATTTTTEPTTVVSRETTTVPTTVVSKETTTVPTTVVSKETTTVPTTVTNSTTVTATTTKTEPTTVVSKETTTATATTTVEKPTTVTATSTVPTTVTNSTTVTATTTKTEPTTVVSKETTTATATTTVDKPTTVTATTTAAAVTHSTTATTTATATTTVDRSTTVTATTTVPTTVVSKETTTATATTTVDKPTTVTATTTVPTTVVSKETTTATATTTVEKPTTVTKSTTVEKPTTVVSKETTTATATTTVEKPTTVTKSTTVTTTEKVVGATGKPAAPSVDSTKVVDTPAGREVTLVASTTPGTEGEMVFVTKDGTVIGKAPIGKDGRAELKHTFDTPGTYEVQSYVQAPDGTKGEKSPTFTVTVADKGGSSKGSSNGSSASLNAKSSESSNVALYSGIGALIAFLLGAIGVALLGHPDVKRFFASLGIRY